MQINKVECLLIKIRVIVACFQNLKNINACGSKNIALLWINGAIHVIMPCCMLLKTKQNTFKSVIYVVYLSFQALIHVLEG